MNTQLDLKQLPEIEGLKWEIENGKIKLTKKEDIVEDSFLDETLSKIMQEEVLVFQGTNVVLSSNPKKSVQELRDEESKSQLADAGIVINE